MSTKRWLASRSSCTLEEGARAKVGGGIVAAHEILSEALGAFLRSRGAPGPVSCRQKGSVPFYPSDAGNDPFPSPTRIFLSEILSGSM
jgi:hypothetical protein